MPLMFAAERSSSGGVMMYLPILLLALVFVLMVLSQRRRASATSRAQNSLTVGDEVRTTSGLYGTLRGLDDVSGQLEIANGVVVRFDRRAILPTVDRPVSNEGETR